jgi:NADH-quinone oxidoreductase subunit G
LAARIARDAAGGTEPGWNPLSVLHTAASRVAGLELGFVPGPGGRDVAGMLNGDMELVFLLGADEIDMSRLGRAFVVYQGTHGDAGAHRADVILPGAAYTEKSATYLNTEGRAQLTAKAAFPPGEAREDWTIIRALSARLGAPLGYDTLEALRARMYAVAPRLGRLDAVEPAGLDGLGALIARQGQVTAEPLVSSVGDFYLSNPIARASAVMAELSALKSGKAAPAAAAE